MSPLSLSRALQLAVIVGVISSLAGAVRELTMAADAVSAVWPISGLILAVCVRWAQTQRERVVSVAACTAGVMAANFFTGASPALAALLPLVNLIEIAAAVWVFRRYGAPLDSLRAFLIFLGVAVLAAPLVSAFLATGVCFVLAPDVAPQVFMRWLVSTGIGMSILGPFVLSLRGPRRVAFDRRRRQLFIAAQSLLLAASLVIFMQPTPPPLFAIYPFLALAALSHIELGGSIGLLIATLVVVVSTLLGRGPAVIADLTGYARLPVMQLFLASMVFSVLPISALMRRLERYAAELEQRRADAEEISAIKTKLLAYVSHEIRSPLSGVTGLAQLMHDGGLGELTSAQREILGRIAMTGAEVDALASDLVDTAALQSGNARVSIEAVDVAEAARLAVEAVSFRIAQYEAYIEIVPPVPGLEVAADPKRLRQILVNLLVNGAKYGGRPPRVKLSVTVASPGRVRFVVEDNGRGVAPERRAALFGDFERLGAEKTDIAGSGLGLALSREIARLQDGTLGVDDAAEGSRFWLELPLWDDHSGKAAA
jgi:signal transduction histidine kinase